jgi:hypothetical protein
MSDYPPYGPQYGQAPWPPPGPTYAAPPERKDRRWLIIVAAAVLVATVAAAYVIFAGSNKATASEVLLQPTNSAGPYPWTGTVVPVGAPSSVPLPPPTTPTAQVPTGGGQPPLVAVPGDRAGIYGGSLELTVCDKKKLVEFLQQNPAQAAAWAGVLGVSDISTYVGSLAEVLLGADTRVTNHGFHEGKATSFQAVLQAGTAVLIDDRGIPRVRCECGNPLLPPVLAGGPPTYTGTPWSGFDPGRVVVVQAAAVTVTHVTVINVVTGGSAVIPVGGGERPGVTPSETATITQAPPVRVDAIVGYWTGDWGDLLLVDGGGGRVDGAYSFDRGAVTGTLSGGTFVGRWCEEPRAGPTDEGPVEFTFVLVNGRWQIDGRWKYDSDGAAGAWREDWDLSERSGSAPTRELAERAADARQLCG